MHLRPFSLWLCLALLAPAAPLQAHPGGLDQQGGHTDRRTGDYHCHRKPCLTLHRQQQQAEQEAADTQRAFSGLYDRDHWPHWIDADKDCQDTRAEVLIATSEIAVTFTGPDHCTVASGRWYDPYTHQTFTRAGDLDMDHFVPLRHAHGHGGDQWDEPLRRQFANDPDNLIPVSASANRSKGARSPDQWLPDNRRYWCEYGQQWERIKQRYQLMVTLQEADALKQLLSHCPLAAHP